MSKTTSVLSSLGSWLQVITSNVGTLVILILLGHFLIGGVWELKQTMTGIRRYDPRLQLSPYNAMSEADKWTFATEFTEARKHMHFVPYSLWRLDPFKGRFVNINPDGTRKTVKSPAPNAQKVFLLGGSTMWGEGATDEGTIASHLQALLGNQYDVTNFGEVAYNSAQELNVLLERLAKGDIPKVVVFYDGVNDGFASVYSPAVPRAIHSNFQSAFHPGQISMAQHVIDLVKQSGWGRLQDIWQQVAQKLHLPDRNKNTWDARIAPKVDANIAETLHDYDAVITQVQALSKVYGFKAYFFWQPNVFSDHRKPIGFEHEAYKVASPTWQNAMAKLYGAARQHFSHRESERVYFLGDIFDGNREPIFMDWCHIPSAANRQVAQAMAAKISPPKAP